MSGADAAAAAAAKLRRRQDARQARPAQTMTTALPTASTKPLGEPFGQMKKPPQPTFQTCDSQIYQRGGLAFNIAPLRLPASAMCLRVLGPVV